MDARYGKINRVSKFKYLVDIILLSLIHWIGMRKMEMAFHLTENIYVYNKKSLSINAKT